MAAEIILTIPAPTFAGVLQRLGTGHADELAICSVGRHVCGDRIELLHRFTTYVRGASQFQRYIQGLDCPVVITEAQKDVNWQNTQLFAHYLTQGCAPAGVFLALVSDEHAFSAWGWGMFNGEFVPIQLLRLPGAGMFKLAVGSLWPLSQDQGDLAAPEGDQMGAPVHHDPTLASTQNQRRDRLAMFLGKGEPTAGQEILHKASDLGITVIGAGRAGSMLLNDLTMSGVAQAGRIYLIDGDVVEASNLDSMALPPGAVGMNKAEAVAAMTKILAPDANILPLVATLSDTVACEAIASSDIVFTAVDRDSARLGAAALCARFHKVHFDLAGGAAYTANREVAIGGEFRLAIPGSPGCVGCFGPADWARAEWELSLDADAERQLRQGNNPHAERPGSCAALLHSVVGQGMLCFWHFLTAELTHSVWHHLDANSILPTWRDWTTSRSKTECPVCSTKGLSGLGDWDI